MLSRREVVTGGVLGTLAGTAPAEAGQAGLDAEALQAGLSAINRTLGEIRASLDESLQPNLSQGLVGGVRAALQAHLRSSGRFPEFLDIGTNVFFAVYDWHVKHMQQIQILRVADNRMAIQFMFTQLVLRWENDGSYVGTPYDR